MAKLCSLKQMNDCSIQVYNNVYDSSGMGSCAGAAAHIRHRDINIAPTHKFFSKRDIETYAFCHSSFRICDDILGVAVGQY